MPGVSHRWRSCYEVRGEGSDLTATDISRHKFTFTNDYQAEGEDSLWTAIITGGDENAKIGLSGHSEIIKSKSDMTADSGEDFSVQYKVYVGTKAVPGTYTGSVTYTITASFWFLVCTFQISQ